MFFKIIGPVSDHWYEAHGIGQKEFKIKRFLELDEIK
jgi:hypothetical protein